MYVNTVNTIKLKHRFSYKVFELNENSIKWFKLTMFELAMYFNHEMIGIWQTNQRNFELSGINCVRINRASPVSTNTLTR